MKRRGMTMIELLMSLALLSSLLLVTASWSELIGVASRDVAPRARRDAVAMAVLQLIHDDLRSGDFDEDGLKTAEVEASLARLRLRSRAPEHGPVTIEYALSAAEGTITRRMDRSSQSVLMGEVSAFACDLHPDSPVMAVTITMADGRRISREYRR